MFGGKGFSLSSDLDAVGVGVDAFGAKHMIPEFRALFVSLASRGVRHNGF